MSCFSVEEPHVRDWENLMKRRGIINKKISKSGKKCMKTGNELNKTHLKYALRELFESDRFLKERLLSYGFDAIEMQDIFLDEKYSAENEKLKIENEKLQKQASKVSQYETQLNQLKAQNNELKLDKILTLVPQSTDDSLKDYALKIETLQKQLIDQQQVSFKKQQELEHFGKILRDNNIPLTKTQEEVENTLPSRNAERGLTKPFKDDEKLFSMLQEKNKLIYKLQCETSYCKTELEKFKAHYEGLQTKYNEQQIKLEQYNLKATEFQMKQNYFGQVGETIESRNREIQESKIQISNFQVQLAEQHQTCLQKEKEVIALKRTLEDLNVQLKTSRSEKKLSQETAAHLINQLHQQLSKSTEEREHYKLKYEELLSKLQNQASGVQSQKGLASQTESSATKDAYAEGVLNRIEKIRKIIEEVAKQVDEFSGTQDDKVFLHLKELLIKNVLTLDNIESDGNTLIRNKRKEVIKRAYEICDNLVQKSPLGKPC